MSSSVILIYVYVGIKTEICYDVKTPESAKEAELPLKFIFTSTQTCLRVGPSENEFLRQWMCTVAGALEQQKDNGDVRAVLHSCDVLFQT